MACDFQAWVTEDKGQGSTPNHLILGLLVLVVAGAVDVVEEGEEWNILTLMHLKKFTDFSILIKHLLEDHCTICYNLYIKKRITDNHRVYDLKGNLRHTIN